MPIKVKHHAQKSLTTDKGKYMNLQDAHLRIRLSNFEELSRMSLEELIAHRDRDFKEHLDRSLDDVTQDEWNLWIGRKVMHKNKTWDMNKRTVYEVSYLEFLDNYMMYREAFYRHEQGLRAPTLDNKKYIEEAVPF